VETNSTGIEFRIDTGQAMSFMNQVINDIPNISVITKIEVLGYRTTPEAYKLLSGFVEDSVILGLSDEIVERTIELRKEKTIKTPDALIAATDIVNQLALISRNTKDFDKIEGLEIINPYNI